MLDRFGTTKQKDGGDSQHVIRSRLRGTKTLSDLRAMATESARLERLAHIEKPLSKSVKSTVEEYRRQGISRSTALRPRDMTEGQLLLEALSRPDWLNRLQENGIKVNKPTLELISQKLNEIRMKPPEPSDFNPAARNFNKTLYKLDAILEDIGFTALRVEHVGLRGGVFYEYDDEGWYARFMTLQDPSGKKHVFNEGQDDDDIASFTSHWIREYGKVNGGNFLTVDVVESLRKGDGVDGWTCTELTFHPVKKRVYRTDKGTLIYALHNSPYGASPKEYDDQMFPGLPNACIGNPTAAYSCHSLTFLSDNRLTFLSGKNDWLLDEEGSAIQTILEDHEYQPVSDRGNAQVGDIAVYYRDGAITHTAPVRGIKGNYIIVDSKLGVGCRKYHEMSAEQVVVWYGKPTIYHTNREDGHTLLRVTDDTDS